MDLFTSLEVINLWRTDSLVNDDLSVEAASPRERGVEDVDAVSAGEDYNISVRGEAVHLNEELVQGVLSLVITTSADTIRQKQYFMLAL